MTDIFISYLQKSAESATVLADMLRENGYDVWLDSRLLAGQRFDDTIRVELENAEAVLVIWTHHSIHSDYVRMEAGIAWAWEKLIPLKIAELPFERIPAPFRRLQTIDVSHSDGILLALEAKGIKPALSGARKKLSKAGIMSSLRKVDPSLPKKVEAWLDACQRENFRIVVKRSIMVKSTIPDFGEINFCTLFPDGSFQTNYISDSAERLGDPALAAEYLDGVARLIEGGAVRRDGKSWTWRVEVFGELPAISAVLPRYEEWVDLMRNARERFIEAAYSSASES